MGWSEIDSGPPLRRTEVLSDICLSEFPVISLFICIIFYEIALKRIGPRLAQTFHVNDCVLCICVFVYIFVNYVRPAIYLHGVMCCSARGHLYHLKIHRAEECLFEKVHVSLLRVFKQRFFSYKI
jgi:hypothetical protein